MHGYTTGLLSLAAPPVAFGCFVVLNALWVMPVALWRMGRAAAQESLPWLVATCFAVTAVQYVAYYCFRAGSKNRRVTVEQSLRRATLDLLESIKTEHSADHI